MITQNQVIAVLLRLRFHILFHLLFFPSQRRGEMFFIPSCCNVVFVVSYREFLLHLLSLLSMMTTTKKKVVIIITFFSSCECFLETWVWVTRNKCFKLWKKNEQGKKWWRMEMFVEEKGGMIIGWADDGEKVFTMKFKYLWKNTFCVWFNTRSFTKFLNHLSLLGKSEQGVTKWYWLSFSTQNQRHPDGNHKFSWFRVPSFSDNFIQRLPNHSQQSQERF